jgi:NitT/TauT family transport system ATP-binding protein
MTTTVQAAADLTVGGRQGHIVVKGAAKDYVSLNGHVVHALRPVSLTVERGSFVSIVGRSGCGKSTFLRMVAGLERASLGSITIGGELVDGPPDRARYVFQNYNESLLPWRTVEENVRFGLRHNHGPRRATNRREEKELVDAHLAEVGLTGTSNRYPGELSGGMQQRVAIARALAASPEVLLLDEPFSAVDALSRSNLQDLVLRIWHERGLTILFVTHDIEEALFLSQRVVVLKESGGGVDRAFTVDIPYPRSQVEFRENPRYLHLRRQVLGLVLGAE